MSRRVSKRSGKMPLNKPKRQAKIAPAIAKLGVRTRIEKLAMASFAKRQGVYSKAGFLKDKRLREWVILFEKSGLGTRFASLAETPHVKAELLKISEIKGTLKPFMELLSSSHPKDIAVILTTAGGRAVGALVKSAGSGAVGALVKSAGSGAVGALVKSAGSGRAVGALVKSAGSGAVGELVNYAGSGRAVGALVKSAGSGAVGAAINRAGVGAVGKALRLNFNRTVERIKAGKDVRPFLER